MDSNKLIAEFMGYEEQDMSFRIPKNILKIEQENDCPNSQDLDCWDVPLKSLQFHTSWDWLMPVVDKIEQVHKGVPQELMNVNLFSTRDEVYTAVVKYIVGLLGESPSDKRKVLITQREVYHKIATIEIEIPLNVKNDDVADYLNENEELWVNEMDEMLNASDYQGGFGLEGNDMNEKDQDIECRYDIVNENYGGHI